MLFDLERELAGGEIDALFGLSRPSTQFLVRQMAAPYGYVTTFEGAHVIEHGLNRQRVKEVIEIRKG